MNRAFSLLLMFLLVHAQAWAVSGEPVYRVNNLSFSGTYAGVVIPIVGETVQFSTGTNADGTTSTVTGGTGVPGSGSTSATGGAAANDGVLSLTEDERAQLGIFSFSQPAGSGFAQGVIAVFVAGTVFTGAIEGLINPKNGKLNGFVTAAAEVSVDGDTYTSGIGTIQARIRDYLESGSNVAAAATSTTNSVGNRVAARVDGTATLRLYEPSATGISEQRNFGLKYRVEGWQQSYGTAAPTLTDIF